MKRYLIACCGIGMLALILLKFPTTSQGAIAGNQPAAPTATPNPEWCVWSAGEPADGCVSRLQPNPLHSMQQPLIYVNGIQNVYGNHRAALLRLQAVFRGAPTTGIFNATAGSGVAAAVDIWQAMSDVLQCLYGIGESPNFAVKSLASQIRAAKGGLTIVGHSQGAAIISAALCDVLRRKPNFDFSRLKIYTMGGAGVLFVVGPEYHHCIRETDPLYTLHKTSLIWNFLSFNPHIHSPIRQTQMMTLKEVPAAAPGVIPLNPFAAAISYAMAQHSLDNYIRDCFPPT